MLNRNFADIMVAQIKNVAPRVHLIDNTWYNGNNIGNFFTSLRTIENQLLSTNTSTHQFCTFIIGSGKTAPTYEDFELANRIDETGFAISNSSLSLNAADQDNRKVMYSQTWSYTGNDTIEVWEFALVNNEGYYSNHHHIVDRTVLKNPIIVTNNSSFVISLEIGGKGSITPV